MMDSFLTSPFISKFPNHLKQTFFSGNSNYYDLYKAIKSGRLVAGMNGEAFVDLLYRLRETEPELYKQFSSLEASGKLQVKQSDQKIHDSLKKIKIRKGILKEISQGYSQPAQSVFHDDVGDSQKKLEIIKAGGKPLIDDEDLNSGLVSYLFNEESIPLNRGERFNWSRFLSDYIYPFTHIRILDPYLYKNVKDIDLNNMLKTLMRQSDPEKLTIEIVSHLEADDKWRKEDAIEKLLRELDLPKSFMNSLTLYHQKGSASNVFHKRAIWTNFWTLLTERGFDFLKLETGKGTVTRENTLFLTGKYSSENSLWHQIDNNWKGYLKKSDLINF
jgi:hypothetical protein